MNYYRRYSGDYLRDTSRLSMVDHGAYTLMLDYYYSEEKPLPLDREEIYTMTRAMKPADRAAVDKILDRYFMKADDGYHNGRADEELALAAPIIEASRVNGKKGGRRKNPTVNPEGNPPGSDEYIPDDNPVGYMEHEPSGLEAGQHPPSTNHITTTPLTTDLQPPTTNREGQKQAPRPTAASLPDWIPRAAWHGYVEMRKKIRAPMTARAQELAIGKLDELRAKGHSPQVVLDLATERSWRGIFEPNGNKALTTADRNERAKEEWLNSR